MYKVAVIQFPGSNREYELVHDTFSSVGMHAELFRWNRKDTDTLRSFDAYALPGGFSYQDRVRAGVVAAKDKLMKILAEEAEKGKPILGICNGCQILAEAGLVPQIYDNEVSMGLAPNAGKQNGQTVRTGFISDWYNMKSTARKGRSFANYLVEEGEIFPVPIAHAEGRFRMSDEVLREMEVNGQIIFTYCDQEGNVSEEYPVNPNGSTKSIAGVSNKRGNVVAIMPHPEAANQLFQIPLDISEAKQEAWGNYDKMEGPGPTRRIFESVRAYLEEMK